jgi:hypothetical protein
MESVMAKFKMGGSGPDGKGLGWIAGLDTKRRFDKSGEIYETDNPGEIQVLRRCPYVEEIADQVADPQQAESHIHDARYERAGEALGCEKMRELIKIGCGLYRVGMTKAELIDKILASRTLGRE